MLVSEKDALERLASPLNLMNRLNSSTKRRDGMGLFGINRGIDRNNTKPAAPAASFNPLQKDKPESTALVPTVSNTPASNNTESPQTPDSPESKEPSLDDLVGNADSQVKLAHAHDEALGVLVESVKMIRTKLDDIKPEKLPSVIAATSKVVDQIQRQRIDATKSKEGKAVHFHFYTPTQRKVEEYEVVDVG